MPVSTKRGESEHAEELADGALRLTEGGELVDRAEQDGGARS